MYTAAISRFYETFASVKDMLCVFIYMTEISFVYMYTCSSLDSVYHGCSCLMFLHMSVRWFVKLKFILVSLVQLCFGFVTTISQKKKKPEQNTFGCVFY